MLTTSLPAKGKTGLGGTYVRAHQSHQPRAIPLPWDAITEVLNGLHGLLVDCAELTRPLCDVYTERQPLITAPPSTNPTPAAIPGL